MTLRVNYDDVKSVSWRWVKSGSIYSKQSTLFLSTDDIDSFLWKLSSSVKNFQSLIPLSSNIQQSRHFSRQFLVVSVTPVLKHSQLVLSCSSTAVPSPVLILSLFHFARLSLISLTGSRNHGLGRQVSDSSRGHATATAADKMLPLASAEAHHELQSYFRDRTKRIPKFVETSKDKTRLSTLVKPDLKQNRCRSSFFQSNSLVTGPWLPWGHKGRFPSSHAVPWYPANSCAYFLNGLCLVVSKTLAPSMQPDVPDLCCVQLLSLFLNPQITWCRHSESRD